MVNIIDHDKHFLIDPLTRRITPETPEKNKIVQYDHKSERFTFEIPRTIEGYDMSLCNVIQFHFINTSSDKQTKHEGLEESNDSMVSEDGDKVIFSWLLSRNATKYSGTLSFSIRFAKVNDGEAEYEWYTEIHNGITVSTTINNSGSIAEDYADVLEQWREKLFGTYENMITIHLPVDRWVEGFDTSHYVQDLFIDGLTENSKIDLQPSPEQLVSMINDGIVIFVENNNGKIKVYSVNEKPTTDITIQATVKEVIL